MQRLLIRSQQRWKAFQHLGSRSAELTTTQPRLSAIWRPIQAHHAYSTEASTPTAVGAENHNSAATTNNSTTAAKASNNGAPATFDEISIDDFAKINLAVGTILKVETVPKSKKLFKLTVDLGQSAAPNQSSDAELSTACAPNIRTILSGVRQYYPTEESIQQFLLNKQCIVVENLKPRSMMGHLSHGMILFATGVDSEGNPSISLVNPNNQQNKSEADTVVVNGTRVM